MGRELVPSFATTRQAWPATTVPCLATMGNEESYYQWPFLLQPETGRSVASDDGCEFVATGSGKKLPPATEFTATGVRVMQPARGGATSGDMGDH